MANKYPAYCAKCKTMVEVGKGKVAYQSGQYLVEHFQCPEAAIEQKKKDDAYMAQLRQEVLADPKCRAWLSARGRYV